MREPTKQELSVMTSVYADDFIVVSRTYGTEDLGRDEILKAVKSNRKSKKRPKHEHLSAQIFEERLRRLYVTNRWEDPDCDKTLFDLYSNIDSVARYAILFRLLDEHPPSVIASSVLTFVAKCLNKEMQKGSTFSYKRVMKAKERRIRANCLKAVEAYLNFSGDARTQCIVLVMTLGGV